MLTYLNGGTTGIISKIRLISRVGQTRQPPNMSLGTGTLSVPYGVPYTGQPMGDECKGSHEKDEDGSSVLGVSVNLSGDSDKTEKAGCFQQTN